MADKPSSGDTRDPVQLRAAEPRTAALVVLAARQGNVSGETVRHRLHAEPRELAVVDRPRIAGGLYYQQTQSGGDAGAADDDDADASDEPVEVIVDDD